MTRDPLTTRRLANPMTPAADPCRFGPHCRARVKGAPAPAESRGLCLACELHGLHILRQFPGAYTALVRELGKDAGRSGLGGVPSTAVEAPTPIREHIDALVREIVHDLTTWEIPVREVANLSEAPERGVRFGVAVNRAARTLVDFFSVLLALPLTAHVPYGACGVDEMAELDGPGAVVHLAALYHRVERTLGLTVAREPRPGPCPNCRLEEITHPDGMVTTALVWTVGDSDVCCRNCGWTIRAQDYTGYMMAFTPPASRRALVG
jgi:hypothetical protein